MFRKHAKRRVLNHKVSLFYKQHDIRLLRILTERGTEYCGARDHYEYELYLAVEDIEHTKTKAKSPQTNGICERFHRTMQDEFYRAAFRKKIYESIEQLQEDLNVWISDYNENRPHSGKYCYSKMPMQTFTDSITMAKENMFDQLINTECG